MEWMWLTDAAGVSVIVALCFLRSRLFRPWLFLLAVLLLLVCCKVCVVS